jgi:hypothetical protein
MALYLVGFGEVVMKKIFVALIATVVAVGLSGCVGLGKGKAPPIVTKG